MLHTLHIRDLALIESAEVRFAEGLTVVSGETGGGKSLLVTALALLRGVKASASLVRYGASELQVDGEFHLAGGERSQAIERIVAELGCPPPEDNLLLVTRIVDRSGRTRVRIGGRPATLAALRQLGAVLLEIHGQGETRALMRPEIQCETLDAFAGTSLLRREFAAALQKARSIRSRLDELASGHREKQQRLEFLRFQHATITDLQLEDGELDSLESEHQVLENLDGLRQRLDEALVALQDDEGSVSDRLGKVAKSLQHVVEIDRKLEPVAERMDEIEELVSGVCRDLQSRRAALDLDPARRSEVAARLDEIHEVLRRFGPTEADLRRTFARIGEELAEAERANTAPADLTEELREATEHVRRLGARLARARGKESKPFCACIRAELSDLGMPHTEVRVAMSEKVSASRVLDEATEHGPSPVDIEVRINPGEPFHSMREVASGGELARIVLAVKKTLADQDRVPLLVLDEIDAEIGGRLGLAVGRKLHEVARHHQVVIVTHLAPVAAWAQHHFVVSKQVDATPGDERTRSSVRLLKTKEVERELAAMATGDEEDAASLRQARRLVAKAKELGESS